MNEATPTALEGRPQESPADRDIPLGALAFTQSNTAHSEGAARDVPHQGEPQHYAFPEDVDLDMEAVEKFKPLMAEMGVSAENAQRLVDLAVEMHRRAKTGSQGKEADTLAAWSKASHEDGEFGGAVFERSVVEAQKAMRHFASPAFIEMLDATGLGNHPEMIRLFCKIAKGISEDRFIGHQGGGASGKSLADILYGPSE